MKFGGNLSVQKLAGDKPLLTFGYDECIYKQFIFSTKAWVGLNGETVLIPKDEGPEIMILAFQS